MTKPNFLLNDQHCKAGGKKHSISNARKLLWPLFRAMLIIGLAYVILYPLLYMVSMGFRGVDDLYDPTVNWVPKNFTLENLSAAFKTLNYFPSFKNSLFISLICSVLLLIPDSMIAYSLSRFKYRGQNFIFALVLITIIVPLEFITLPSFLNFSKFSGFGVLSLYNLITGANVNINIADTMLTFILPAVFGIGIRSGLYIYILRQFFKGLPKELEEAACIDGCGFFATFVRIVIPNAVPAFSTAFLFSFVWHWNDYQLSSMYMPTFKTLSAALKTIGEGNYSDKSFLLVEQIACLLVILPVLLLYLPLQRFFTESIERTGLVE